MMARLCRTRPGRRDTDARPSCWTGSTSADAGKRRVGTYSGGMRRRLDLAASLVGRPSVIFLDEPTTGLDPRSRQAMWQIITSLAGSGVTVFLTTQYLEEADQLADRIVVLDAGRVVADGSAAELKQRYGRPAARTHRWPRAGRYGACSASCSATGSSTVTGRGSAGRTHRRHRRPRPGGAGRGRPRPAAR